MQNVLVIIRLRCGRHRRERQYQQHIAAHAMILVHRLSIVDAAEHHWHVVLRDADEGLHDEEDVGDQAEDGVRGAEVLAAVGDFVVFDYYEAGDEGEDAGAVEDGVNGGALLFLFGGVGWLQDEDCLRAEEDAGGVEELSQCGQYGRDCGGKWVRTGWAEKSIRGWMKTLAQTVAASWGGLAVGAWSASFQRLTIQMPACARTAVPMVCSQYNGSVLGKEPESVPMTGLNCIPLPSCCDASPALPSKGSSSPRPGWRARLSSGSEDIGIACMLKTWKGSESSRGQLSR